LTINLLLSSRAFLARILDNDKAENFVSSGLKSRTGLTTSGTTSAVAGEEIEGIATLGLVGSGVTVVLLTASDFVLSVMEYSCFRK
jgi:hypothetical protein